MNAIFSYFLYYQDHIVYIFFLSLLSSIAIAIGSFLNVVIVRLPELIQNRQIIDTSNNGNNYKKCNGCNNGKHYNTCNHFIPFRYLLVKILTLLFSISAAIRFGFSLQLALALLLIWALIALAFIDIEQLILPNIITLPFTGLGLIINFFDILLPFWEASLGMVFGYTFLWSISYSYKILTTKDALGFGDIKLLAMLGAWMGWKILPFIILFSSIFGVAWGSILMVGGRANKDTPLPFGAFLSFAGIIALVFDKSLVSFHVYFT